MQPAVVLPDAPYVPQVQRPVHVLEVRPVVAPNVPAGHGVAVLAPAGQKEPKGQERHAELDVLLVLGLYEPAAHGVATPAPAGQKEPTGHRFCVAEQEPAGQ